MHDSLFLKHVPPDLHAAKTGLKIAIFSVYNAAGQLSTLFRFLNRHTIHSARMIIVQDDYLDYDRDIVLSGPETFSSPRIEIDENSEALAEARAILHDADFFHIGMKPISVPGVSWSTLLDPRNALVQYFGSDIRREWPGAFDWHVQTGITGLSFWDYTMLQRGLFFYHTNLMFDSTGLATRHPILPDEPLTICHAPTIRAQKNTDFFLGIMDRLTARGVPVRLKLIEGVPNAECLQIKRTCQATFDQISPFGIYALTAIESMAIGHAVLCSMSNFAMSYAPDSPIIQVTKDTLKHEIERLATDRKHLSGVCSRSVQWAKAHHDPARICRQYLWLYDLVVNGHRMVSDPDEYMLGREEKP